MTGSTQKTILLITTGSSMKRFVFERLKALNYRIVALEPAENWAGPWVDDWILADSRKPQDCLNAVRNYRQQHRIDAILTFDEFAVELCAFLVTELGYRGITGQVAQRCRNKFQFRRFCQASQINAPQFRHIESEADLDYVRQNFPPPVIVKPTDKADSEQVQAIEDLTRLNLAEHRNFLVESLLSGQEIDVDILVQKGQVKFLSLTDNFNTNWPYFLQNQSRTPSALSPEQWKSVETLAVQLIEALKIVDGCLHLEAMVHQQQACPLELNLRMGAVGAYYLNQSVYGVDLVEAIAKLHLGETLPPLPQTPQRHAVLQYLYSSNAGALTEVDLSKVDRDQVDVLSFFGSPGDTVQLPPDDYGALGYVGVSASGPEAADQKLQAVVPTIQYTVEPIDQ